MKNKILITILCTVSLTACTMHKVTNKEQLCAQAQRQASLNQATPQVNASNLIGVKKTQLNDAIKQDCDTEKSNGA